MKRLYIINFYRAGKKKREKGMKKEKNQIEIIIDNNPCFISVSALNRYKQMFDFIFTGTSVHGKFIGE